MYKTTREFLVQFGLNSLAELPTLKEFEELGRLALTDEEVTAPPEPAQSAETNAEPAAETNVSEETDALTASVHAENEGNVEMPEEPLAAAPSTGGSVSVAGTDDVEPNA